MKQTLFIVLFFLIASASFSLDTVNIDSIIKDIENDRIKYKDFQPLEHDKEPFYQFKEENEEYKKRREEFEKNEHIYIWMNGYIKYYSDKVKFV